MKNKPVGRPVWIDRFGMVLRKPKPWEEDLPEHRRYGQGDSIGRTFLLWYGDRFIDEKGLGLCLGAKIDAKKRTVRYRLYRHPEWRIGGPDDISRDHVAYWLIWLALSDKGEAKDLQKIFLKHNPWRISEKYTMTVDFWLWTRILVDGSRPAAWAYYTLMIPWMALSLVWQRLIRWIGGFSEEKSIPVYLAEPLACRPNKLQSILRKALPRTYALHILGWQLKVIPDCPAKRILKWICRRMTGRTNYVVQMLFGAKNIKYHWIQNLNTYRWSTRLDETNDRWIRCYDSDTMSPSQYATNINRQIFYALYDELKQGKL